MRFQADGYEGKGLLLFRDGDSAIREGDSAATEIPLKPARFKLNAANHLGR